MEASHCHCPSLHLQPHWGPAGQDIACVKELHCVSCLGSNRKDQELEARGMHIKAQDMPLSDTRDLEQSVQRPQSAKPVAHHEGGHRDGHSFCTYENAFGPGDLHRGSQVPSMERHGQGYPERSIHWVKITLH